MCFFFFSPPFTAYNQKELAERIREGKFRRIPYRYSDELNTLLCKMLNLKVWIYMTLQLSLSEMTVVCHWNLQCQSRALSLCDDKWSSYSILPMWETDQRLNIALFGFCLFFFLLSFVLNLAGVLSALVPGLSEAVRGVHPPEQPVGWRRGRGTEEGPGEKPAEVGRLGLSTAAAETRPGTNDRLRGGAQAEGAGAARPREGSEGTRREAGEWVDCG